MLNMQPFEDGPSDLGRTEKELHEYIRHKTPARGIMDNPRWKLER